jgi:hypothetical protein
MIESIMAELRESPEPKPSSTLMPPHKTIAESSMEPNPQVRAVPIYKSRSLEILSLGVVVTLLVALGTALYLRDSIKTLETKITQLEPSKSIPGSTTASHDTASLELVAKITDILKETMGALTAERREVERLRHEIDSLKVEKQKISTPPISSPQISSPQTIDNGSPSTH